MEKRALALSLCRDLDLVHVQEDGKPQEVKLFTPFNLPVLVPAGACARGSHVTHFPPPLGPPSWGVGKRAKSR